VRTENPSARLTVNRKLCKSAIALYCFKYEFIVLLQSIISWTVVLSHHVKRYSHTITHIHIHPQNNRRWPLCKSANVGIAA
jgi:hypothetical protein